MFVTFQQPSLTSISFLVICEEYANQCFSFFLPSVRDRYLYCDSNHSLDILSLIPCA
uniref:Uncharacterized protein n=1 Tax=Utricularia reniformis TaxID=192314 RepID=A0A1Y0B0N4_9LAMI|nr:hypothetical protein AEK19_MT0683 [Utricularia reniformis]ART30931.1 hypothetical protein AEK19_MT0683 [Utricularia reniformis]